jgi:Holliday junction resolvasome RuvABC endonuclease subunit
VRQAEPEASGKVPGEGTVFRMSVVMGLDLSCTATGIVVLSQAGDVLRVETVGSNLKRESPVREKVERLWTIATHVVEAFDKYSVERVAIEGYAWGARGAQNDLAELHGVVKSQLWRGRKCEPQIVQCSAARKTVLGAGRIDKKDIVRMVHARGVLVSDHNQADAWVVAEWMRLQLQ